MIKGTECDGVLTDTAGCEIIDDVLQRIGIVIKKSSIALGVIQWVEIS